MSWSFSAAGKPQAVAAKARETKALYPCQEPEESIRKAALELIAVAAEAQGPGTVLKVSGSGSMYTNNGAVQSSQLTISVEPIYGFLE